jgi:hypothetical protein
MQKPKRGTSQTEADKATHHPSQPKSQLAKSSEQPGANRAADKPAGLTRPAGRSTQDLTCGSRLPTRRQPPPLRGGRPISNVPFVKPQMA